MRFSKDWAGKQVLTHVEDYTPEQLYDKVVEDAQEIYGRNVVGRAETMRYFEHVFRASASKPLPKVRQTEHEDETSWVVGLESDIEHNLDWARQKAERFETLRNSFLLLAFLGLITATVSIAGVHKLVSTWGPTVWYGPPSRELQPLRVQFWGGAAAALAGATIGTRVGRQRKAYQVLVEASSTERP